MTVKQHYDQHLSFFYEWMVGDSDALERDVSQFFITNGIADAGLRATDLGCGHGIHSIALAKLGMNVLAIDFNALLLQRLQSRRGNLNIRIVNDDILNFRAHQSQSDIVVCMGDTLAHLPDPDALVQLFQLVASGLVTKGSFVVSFRDYSEGAAGTRRIIPVKSDSSRILTCILDFAETKVTVTDLLHEKVEHAWEMKVSSYEKLRLTQSVVEEAAHSTGFSIGLKQFMKGQWHLILSKG